MSDALQESGNRFKPALRLKRKRRKEKVNRKEILGIMLSVIIASTLGVTACNLPAVIAQEPPIEVWSDFTLNRNITFTGDGLIVMQDNIVIDGAGYWLEGSEASHSKGIDLSNRSNVIITNIGIRAFDYGIYLLNSSYNSIYENNARENAIGIAVTDFSAYNRVSENRATKNTRTGILLQYSSGNKVIANNVTENGQYGIELVSSNNNNIIENNPTANSWSGIASYLSSDNNIYGNSITNNYDGIRVYNSSFNKVIANNMRENDRYGIYFRYAPFNTIYHNNFMNNFVQQAFCNNSINAWDNGYPSGGNYWSDYAGVDQKKGPNQDQLGSDGIGDTPYVIDVDNQDRYPLIKTQPTAVGITFSQVDFVFPYANVPNSNWGHIDVDVAEFTAGQDLHKGYLNIYTDAGWGVQNQLIDSASGINVITIYFDLGVSVGTDVTSLTAHLEFTSEPYITFADGVRIDYPVCAVEYNAEGAGPLNTDAIPMPLKRLTFNPAGENYAFTKANRKGENVQAATSQCFPMSIANSLQYLENRYNLRVPHEHRIGLRGDNSLVGQLDSACDRYAPSRRVGSGVWFDDMLQGKFKYLSENGLSDSLIHKHQGYGYGLGILGAGPSYGSGQGALPPGDFTRYGITSKDESVDGKVTFEWIEEQLKKCEDVEVVFTYEDATGRIRGGHAVRVFGCGMTLGVPWLRYKHDRLQTNRDRNDVRGLEEVQVQVPDLDGDGMLNFGSMTQEICFALSESPKKLPHEILYGSVGLELITIDTRTGAGSLVGPFGLNTSVWGLEYDPMSDTLYGVTNDVVDVWYNGQLLRIDRTTGAATPIGGLVGQRIEGLAYDSMNDKLYGVDTRNNFVLIDTSTGAGTVIGSTGFPNLEGLAFNPIDGRLYSVDVGSGELVRIDPSTGIATAVAPSRAQIRGLSFDRSGTLYGVWNTYDGNPVRLVTIDTSTGQVTDVGSTGYWAVEGLAFAYYQLPSDLNRDRVVNIIDIAIVARAFGARPGDPTWDPIADLDGNGVINIIDIAIVARDFGITY